MTACTICNGPEGTVHARMLDLSQVVPGESGESGESATVLICTACALRSELDFILRFKGHLHEFLSSEGTERVAAAVKELKNWPTLFSLLCGTGDPNAVTSRLEQFDQKYLDWLVQGWELLRLLNGASGMTFFDPPFVVYGNKFTALPPGLSARLGNRPHVSLAADGTFIRLGRG